MSNYTDIMRFPKNAKVDLKSEKSIFAARYAGFSILDLTATRIMKEDPKNPARSLKAYIENLYDLFAVLGDYPVGIRIAAKIQICEKNLRKFIKKTGFPPAASCPGGAQTEGPTPSPACRRGETPRSKGDRKWQN